MGRCAYASGFSGGGLCRGVNGFVSRDDFRNIGLYAEVSSGCDFGNFSLGARI